MLLKSMTTQSDNSTELFNQTHLSNQKGVISALVKSGHRNELVFNMDTWFSSQGAALGLGYYEAYINPIVRKTMINGILEALEAGHELGYKNFLQTFRSLSLIPHEETALTTRAEKWMEYCLENNMFRKIKKVGDEKAYEENHLTIEALSFVARLNSLPLLKAMVDRSEVLNIDKIPLNRGSRLPCVLISTLYRPSQIPMLSYLLDLQSEGKMKWASPYDNPFELAGSAISNMNKETLRYLVSERNLPLEKMQEANDKERWGGFLRYAVMTANSENIFNQSQEEISLKIIGMLDTLLDLGVSSERIPGKEGLLSAILESRHPTKDLLTWALSHGSDINEVNENNKTAFCLAVFKGKYELADFLLEQGANINALVGRHSLSHEQNEPYSTTTLKLAIWADNENVIKYLMDCPGKEEILPLNDETIAVASPRIAVLLNEFHARQQKQSLGQSTPQPLLRGRRNIL